MINFKIPVADISGSVKKSRLWNYLAKTKYGNKWFWNQKKKKKKRKEKKYSFFSGRKSFNGNDGFENELQYHQRKILRMGC